MGDFIAQCRMMFDLVVIDAPPVRLVTDPLLFAAKVTHVLLVVKVNSTQMRDVQEAAALMRRVQTPLLGVLFNYVKTSWGMGIIIIMIIITPPLTPRRNDSEINYCILNKRYYSKRIK